MGDIGSATLGLITFSIALIAQQQCQIPILYWFMLNGLFLFDATSTLIRRMIKREKWFAPHRKHAYQRLRQSGIFDSQDFIRSIFNKRLFLYSCIFCKFEYFFFKCAYFFSNWLYSFNLLFN